jgi:TRAP-type C4-dicarboxylate transport system permease small subunit
MRMNVHSRVLALSAWLARVGGLLVLGSALLITLDVMARNLLRSTFFESFELSGYAFAVATSFGLAHALVTRAHIRIEVLYERLPLTARAVLDLLALATLLLTAGVLLWWCSLLVWDNAVRGARSNSALSLRLAWPQALWWLGLAWFVVVIAWLWLRALVALARGRAAAVVQESGVARLQDEIDAAGAGSGVSSGACNGVVSSTGSGARP